MDEPFFLALLAECALADGRVDEADEALAHARRPTRAGRDFFYAPELLRLDALVQAETGEADAALARLDAATGSARYLGALSLELRAATTRVQLALRGIGEADPAAHGLADVLSQLPEGAGTEDVRRGHALLAQTGVA
jgi:predicted ATPase